MAFQFTCDNHVNHEHAQVVDDDAGLEDVTAGRTESVGGNAGVRGGFGGTAESENHIDRLFRQHRDEYDRD